MSISEDPAESRRIEPDVAAEGDPPACDAVSSPRLRGAAVAAALAVGALLLGASTAAALTLHALTPQGCISDPDVGDPGCGETAQGLNAAIGVAVSPDGDSVYAVGALDHAIARFDRSAGGALTPQGCISDSDFGDPGCGATAQGLGLAYDVAVSPDGSSVYAVAAADGAIARFDRSAGGALTPQGCISDPDVGDPGCGETAQGLGNALGVAVSPDGDSVYVASFDDDAIVRFDRSAGGALSNPSCVSDVGDTAGCGATAQGLNGAADVAVSPDGGSVYAVAEGDDAIVRFDRSAGGALSNPSCVSDVGDPAGCGTTAQGLDGAARVAVSPDGGSVYPVSVDDRAIVRFDRSAGGALSNPSCVADVGDTAGCGATAQGLNGAIGVAVSPDGGSVYAVAVGDTAIVRFDRSAGGALSNPSCIADVGFDPGCGTKTEGLFGATDVAVSPDDASVYAVSQTAGAIVRFDRELAPVCRTTSSTGEPGAVQTVPLDCSDANGDPIEIEVVKGPQNGTLGAVNQADHTVAYTPDGGFAGADSFDVRASSDGKHSNTATAVVGVQSATGPQGNPGPQGKPGVDRALLAAAIAADVTKAKGSRANVRIVTTLPGTATLEATPGGKPIRGGAAKRAKTRTTSEQLASAGRHTLSLSKLKRGTRYGLTLSVSSADGQEATDTAKLKVAKKKK